MMRLICTGIVVYEKDDLRLVIGLAASDFLGYANPRKLGTWKLCPRRHRLDICLRHSSTSFLSLTASAAL
jgi:hypothetical protein